MGAVEEVLCVTKEHSGDGCELSSTKCKYDLRKGDLFVLSDRVGLPLHNIPSPGVLMKSIGAVFFTTRCTSWRQPHAWDAVSNNTLYTPL